MGQFAIMVGQLVGFFIMLIVGYGCVRLRFYGQTALDGMCSLLLNVLIPLLVFSNAMAGADRAQVEANWGAMLLTAVMYALLILVFRLVAWALRLKGSRSHVFQAALIFGNWRILPTLGACLLFGFARSGGYRLVQVLQMPSSYQDLVMILPYVLTLLLLVFFSKQNGAPRALGVIYDKGAR